MKLLCKKNYFYMPKHFFRPLGLGIVKKSLRFKSSMALKGFPLKLAKNMTLTTK